MGEDRPIRLASEAPFAVGAMAVTPAVREVAWPSGRRTLEPRVMQVLVALAGADGAVVGRDTLVQRCWEGRVVGDAAINRVISLLRQLAAETQAFSVETVTKVGYRLQPAETATVARPVSATMRTPTASLIGLAMAGLILALLLGYWANFVRGAAPPEAIGRVAVGRFEVHQADPELERLAAGLSDALVGVLTRSGVEALHDGGGKGGRGDLRIAGSLDREAGELIVSTRVLDRKTGMVLSTLRLTRPADAAAGLADQAALNLAAGLDCALEDRKRSGRNFSPTVLALYLNTCDAIAREGNGPRMLTAARRLVAAAPDLAVAQALFGVAQANAALDLDLASEEAKALRQGARDAAAQALALDPKTPKAYLAIANSYRPGGQWAERERNYLMARQIDPNLGPGRMSYVGLLREVGRVREAFTIDEHAMDSADPRTLIPARVFGVILNAQLGDLDEAEARLAELERLDPQTAQGLAWRIATNWQAPGPARARVRTLVAHGAVKPKAAACVLDYLDGDIAAATRRGLPTSCAGAPADRRVMLLARQGDTDGAYAEIDDALATNGSTALLFDPAMKGFRADPRFIPLARRLGLVDYWRQGHWPDFCTEPGLPYDCRTAFGLNP